MAGTMNIKSNRTGKLKVKSGCRTLKCDEGRPACVRCTSTGRTCDGYGIWGGGNRLIPRNSPAKPQLLIPTPQTLSLIPSTPEEIHYLSHFHTHTSFKLPGSFPSSFWSTLLLQASITEPAILHAILALGSFHSRLTRPANQKLQAIDRQEVFMLQHYGLAISCLQPRFEEGGKGATRVALIGCVVFICFDFLRGHFTSGQLHFKNGLRILAASYGLPSPSFRENEIENSGGEVIHLKPTDDAIDTWIIEAFSRLHLQVALFNTFSTPTHPQITLHLSLPRLPSPTFNTINEAWKSLERLFNLTFHLKSCFSSSQSPIPTTHLLKTQTSILTGLSTWLSTYRNSYTPFPYPNGANARQWAQEAEKDIKKTHHIIPIYHTLCHILVLTALSATESIYETKEVIELWERLLRGCINLYKSSLPLPPPPPEFKQKNLIFISHSVMDFGWIPPLYHLSTKCRIPRLRLHALKFLSFGKHREGCWDGGISGAVAGRIVELESPLSDLDSDGYSPAARLPNFGLTDYPTPEDMILGEGDKGKRRVKKIDIRMLGEPVERVEVRCSFDGEGDERELVGVWDVRTGVWEG